MKISYPHLFGLMQGFGFSGAICMVTNHPALGFLFLAPATFACMGLITILLKDDE